MVADDASVICVPEEGSGCLILHAHSVNKTLKCTFEIVFSVISLPNNILSSGSLILVVQPITIQYILYKPTQQL